MSWVGGWFRTGLEVGLEDDLLAAQLRQRVVERDDRRGDLMTHIDKQSTPSLCLLERTCGQWKGRADDASQPCKDSCTGILATRYDDIRTLSMRCCLSKSSVSSLRRRAVSTVLVALVAVAVVGRTDTSDADTATRRRSTSSNACSAVVIDKNRWTGMSECGRTVDAPVKPRPPKLLNGRGHVPISSAGSLALSALLSLSSGLASLGRALGRGGLALLSPLDLTSAAKACRSSGV